MKWLFQIGYFCAKNRPNHHKNKTTTFFGGRLRESAGALMLFCYSQLLKELCKFSVVHSHYPHGDYTITMSQRSKSAKCSPKSCRYGWYKYPY